MLKKSDLLPACTESDGDIYILLTVIPESKKDEIVGLQGTRIKLKVRKEPVLGKANDAVIELLSDYFNISKERIIITQGKHSKNKRILIKCITIEELLLKL